ncbi:MAG: NUDIX hydrolase [Candidatus Bathyarchaeota archaeon]|uniref:NUDIX hydrolase n=2 Tax=Candidatus Bathycorpusculum sp. TaxID=2994959 RepID=UPI002829B093|nr:NUDIX hydrolase [Candidatus Termiticorpusculum sp.]MCL2292768.1 NUDIX hydrolase [Candidatus Termiticorpusculum sp.]
MKSYCGRTATAIILYSVDKVLLIKRDTLPFRGYWALPGGRMELGEVVEQTCVREVREETGLDVEVVYKLGDYHEYGCREGVVYDYYPTCFVVEVVGGEVRGQESEVQEIELFSLNELPSPLAFEHDRMINDYKKMFKI